MPEPCNTDPSAVPQGIRAPLHRMTHVLRAIVALLMATLAVVMYAGVAALILPIVVLRSVFDDRGRRLRRVGARAPATEFPLPGRSVPFPAAFRRPQGSPTAK